MPTIAFTLLWNVGLATLLAILVGLLSRSKILQRRPGLTHTLWLLVLAKLVTPPLIPLPLLPSLNVDTRSAPANIAWRQPSSAKLLPIESSLVPSQGEMMNALRSNRSLSMPWFAMLLGLSGCGTVVLVTWSLSQLWRVSRILRHAPRGDARLTRLAHAATSQMAARRAPVVCAVEVSLSPFLWTQWSGPVVVLPKGLIERMSDEQITCILCHELAHYARRDHWSNAFAFLVTVSFWWYPVAWWVRRELRAAQEICCDGLVLATEVATRHCYAKTLFQALEFVHINGPLQPTLVSGFGEGSSLRRRFEMIAHWKVTERFSWWAASFLIASAVTLLCVPVRAQPEGRLNRIILLDKPGQLLIQAGQLLVEDKPTLDKDPMHSARVVERATSTFDTLEATVDPTKHCIFVGDTKRNVRTGALRVDLERGVTYTVKATGEAFMTSETGGQADPFPGLVLYYPTDEEDCYAMRMAVVKPGDAVTFQTPWAIGPKDEVYALAFFLAVVRGEHRDSYKLAITKSKDATVGRQIWEETSKQLDEEAARADVELERHLQELDRQLGTTGTRNATEEFRKTFPEADDKVNPVTGRVDVPTQD